MIKKEKISVIVPCYNVEKYIKNLITNLFEQSYKDIEIILVNDGSTDHTTEVLNEIQKQHSELKVIHKENEGVSRARLSGLEVATGDWVSFIDADDKIALNMYEKLMANANKYDVDISHCGYKMVYPNGKVVEYHGTGKCIYANREEGIYHLLKADLIEPSLCNKLYKKSIIENFNNSNIWNESIKINEDLLMNYLVFKKAHSSFYEDLPLYEYTLRHNSATSSEPSKETITDSLTVIKLIISDLNRESNVYKVAYQRYIYALLNLGMQTKYEKIYKEAKKSLREEIISKKIFKYCESNKVILMSLIFSYFNLLFRYAKKVYYHITKVDKKYDIG